MKSDSLIWMHFILISWRNKPRHSDILGHLFSAYLLLAPAGISLIGLYIFDSGFIILFPVDSSSAPLRRLFYLFSSDFRLPLRISLLPDYG